MTKKVRVMVVDDSPVFRALLTEIINADPILEVVAAAEDPYEARDLIKQYHPDVLTLDIEMPKMNGVQFLKNLMRLRPMPVVMISTLTQHGADVTMEALELGAVDYFPKPALDATSEMVDIAYRDMINEKIRMAAGANVASSPSPAETSIEKAKPKGKHSAVDLIAIGASTGGTEAIRQVLSALPDKMPPIVVTQHISALFSGSFARRLDMVCELKVVELNVDRSPLIAGHVYIAPGDKHMVIEKRNGGLFGVLDDRPPVNRHKPSVDVMFDSVAETVGQSAIGVILTGMGNDGGQGLLSMYQQGAMTAAQDEATSVVWGMPRVATELGAAQKQLPLGKVASFLVSNAFKSD
ncbi:protein-glutamate methylesterase/protein-glutamine glutaminase [Thaumasiovibrio subtropicus]|uniref:protein-glutamate methylesterase/protein-glutamine glutaminase n=1 Tax=Thaumasiovibrio subtropicus TaxID=1891207 RepID=UPI000B350F7A|nr:chemotaxis response regulator protein-glutamate methylesterase [Thaumasiovibrio subtropicus]